jgi:DNA-directed RNA polymerase III subunit RPC8
MFVVATLDDTVSIAPHLFNEMLSTIVADELDRKLANTIFKELGLCICLYDILSMGDCILVPSDPNFHVKVKFRYVVFRPNIDEILVGKKNDVGLTHESNENSNCIEMNNEYSHHPSEEFRS